MKGTVFCHVEIKSCTLSAYEETNMQQNKNLFQSLKTSGNCGNTLNRPASDSRPLLWEKSTYFLSVRLAICLLEGLLTRSTCCCMCSQSVSPKKTVELKCKSGGRESVFVEVVGGRLCACACMCVCDFVWRTQQITSKTTLESCVYMCGSVWVIWVCRVQI